MAFSSTALCPDGRNEGQVSACTRSMGVLRRPLNCRTADRLAARRAAACTKPAVAAAWRSPRAVGLITIITRRHAHEPHRRLQHFAHALEPTVKVFALTEGPMPVRPVHIRPFGPSSRVRSSESHLHFICSGDAVHELARTSSEKQQMAFFLSQE